ncbi:MAG: hypothetical protein IT364_06695 [Candidatus Hydrogenedentes bacterium]|nr:hypothetical protein [Candidatus Hydrogenedentota bacterium]
MSRKWVRISIFVVGIPVIVLLILLCIPLLVKGSWNVLWARRDRTESEIKNIDLALTKLLTDVNRQDARGLFVATEFERECRAYMESANLDAFVASTRIYTVCLTALLHDGKNSLEMAGSDNARRWLKMLDPDVYRKLGDSYMSLETDPWGNPYNMFGGPWPAEWGPPALRTYSDSNPAAKIDLLTVYTNDASVPQVGYVPRSHPHFIWSVGPNGLSDQAIYDPSGKYAPPARQHYRPDAAPYELGGGDDINNWDNDAGWRYPQKKISTYRNVMAMFFGCKHDQMSDW